MQKLIQTPGEAHQAWNSNASPLKKSLLGLLVFPLMIVLAACNNTATENTPLEDRNTDQITTPNGNTNNTGINENGTYNGTNGNGVMDGTNTNPNGNGTINEGTVTDPHTIGDDIEHAVDATEDKIEGAIDKNNGNGNGTTNNNR